MTATLEKNFDPSGEMKVRLVVSLPSRFLRDVITDFQFAGSQGTFFSFKQFTFWELGGDELKADGE